MDLADQEVQTWRDNAESQHYIAHELKTPLSAIQGFADMLQKGMAGDLTDKQKLYVQNIQLAAIDLLERIDRYAKEEKL